MLLGRLEPDEAEARRLRWRGDVEILRRLRTPADHVDHAGSEVTAARR
jgi:hypothetical protein